MTTKRLPSKRIDKQKALAQKLARAVFECGSEPRGVCERIQFMIGPYGNERPGGGLCERALVDVLCHALREHQATT